MSTLTTNRQYLDGDDLTQAQLDALADSIETWANGNVDSTNIAAGGVGATQLASSSVTAAKLASDAVTTAKILDSAVTGAKLDSGVVDNATLAYSSSQLKVKDGGVGTTQLASVSVTTPKIAAVNYQISSGSGTYSRSTNSYATVANLSVTIVTEGHPVMLMLISDDSDQSNGSSYICSGSPSADGMARWTRGGSEITSYRTPGSTTSSPSEYFGLGGFTHFDTGVIGSAGSYTYTFDVKTPSTISVNHVKMIAYEIR